MRRSALVFCTVTLFLIGLEGLLSRSLPTRVAVHFAADGSPNRFGSRDELVFSIIGAHAIVSFVFLVVGAGVRVLPTQLINLPRRDFWLAPVRRSTSLDALGIRIFVLGIAINIFVTIVAIASYSAHFADAVRLNVGTLWGSVGLLLAFLVVWVIELFVRFSRASAA